MHYSHRHSPAPHNTRTIKTIEETIAMETVFQSSLVRVNVAWDAGIKDTIFIVATCMLGDVEVRSPVPEEEGYMYAAVALITCGLQNMFICH